MPSVSPLCSPTQRTPRSTPGMNDSRASESCRMVSVSPCPPSNTSWCATSPANRTAWTWMPSTSAPRAPSSSCVVASGEGLFARACATSSAVRRAEPLGASTLLGWCSSTISTESKYGAAVAANRIINTAPMPKLGATRTPREGTSDSQSRSVASRSSSMPVVPTTTSSPWSRHQRMLSITASGVVKSTTTWASRSGPRSSSASTPATSSMSSAASTARQTSLPMRPCAPSTPTRIVMAPTLGDAGGEHAVVVVGADDGERRRAAQQVEREHLHVVDGHRIDVAEDLVDGHHLAIDELGLPEPDHPRPGVLETQDEAATHLPLASVELLRAVAAAGRHRQLLTAQLEHLARAVGMTAGIDAEHSGVGVVRGEGVDGVGEAALLAHLLEQPRRHASAERGVEHAQSEPAVVEAVHARHAEHEVGLLGRTAYDDVSGSERRSTAADPRRGRHAVGVDRDIGERLLDQPDKGVVVEVAGSRDDKRVRPVTTAVVAGDGRPAHRLDRLD